MQDERFEWHDGKARSNIRDHEVSFEEAALALDDDLALDDIDDSLDYGEERLKLIGMAQGQLLAVVFTTRGKRIRIISARKADRHEQDDYYRQGGQA